MNDVFHFAANNFLIPAHTELLPRSDLAFVFGNKQIIPELAAKTSQLYHGGHVDKILVTGGVKVWTGKTEADELRTQLNRRGIPDRAILIENESGNTEENITLGKKIIADQLGLENITTVVSLGHAAAGPRFTMTLASRWPSILPTHISVFPRAVDPEKWWENEAFLTKAYNDKAKLPFYGHMGYIAPVLPSHVNDMIGTRDDLCAPIPQLKVS